MFTKEDKNEIKLIVKEVIREEMYPFEGTLGERLNTLDESIRYVGIVVEDIRDQMLKSMEFMHGESLRLDKAHDPLLFPKHTLTS